MATTSTRIINPTQLGLRGDAAQNQMPFRVLMTVSPGAKALFFAKAKTPADVPLLGHFPINPITVKKTSSVDITSFVTGLTWSASDGEYYTTVNLSLDNTGGTFNQIPHGTKIRIQIRNPFYSSVKSQNSGKYYDSIVAFVFEKERAADGGSQTMSMTCYDRLYWLTQNEFHAVFKSSKKRPQGWTATQMIRHIASTIGVPVGKIDASKKKFKRTELKGTVLECIQKALHLDKTAANRKKKYFVHMRDGKLNVVLENPNPKSVWAITEDTLIESGTMSEVLGDDFATRLKVTANVKTTSKTTRGTKVKKIKEVTITVNPTDKSYQSAFGIISKTAKLKGQHTKAELTQKARVLLNKALAPKRTFSISIRGIPHLWPGSRVYLVSKYFGTKGVLRVTSVNYSLQGGEFTLDLGLGVDTKTAMTTKEMRLYYSKQGIKY